MGKKDPRIDAYIDKAAPFARPILDHLRELVHRSEAEIEETIKWGMPFFECAGIVCHMAAFKAHCAFGLWRGGAIAQTGNEDDAMGQFGRITIVAELPTDAEIMKLVSARVARNRSGEVVQAKKKAGRPAIAMPAELAAALAKSAAARETFGNFPPSQQREYLEWVTEAKTAATRDKRISTAIEWLADGKPRMWKYRK